MAGLKFNFIPLTVISSAEINQNFSTLNSWDVPEDDLTAQITGAAMTFNTLYPYVSGSIIVYVDGIRQRKGGSYDFVESGVQSITFNSGKQPLSGQDLVCSYRRSDL